ncbi:universal stress protein [Telluria beijingensis]|uniref:universal stress protein n=1 Tax=Telluria beijingensis TaxID=3068633 RepID=UPI002795C0E8|nr:universal stress protein [Massilia sp. REN29]
MTYKTILVHAAPASEAQGRIRLAARLARAMQAHLIGSAPTGVSRYTPEATRTFLAAPCAALRDAARRALSRFERLASDEGVVSVETRLVDDETGVALALDARYCDLVVVGGADGNPGPLRPQGLAQHLVLAGGRPVLVVPAGAEAALPGGAALVAWNASTQATRAIDGALPLLRAARHATVLGLSSGADDGGESGPRLAAFLRRHGVATRTAVRPAATDPGAALLAEAERCGASLLVMGAYGHARWREALFHGPSATVLRRPACPILLAH